MLECQNDIEAAAAVDETRDGFIGYGGFLAIVKDYIMDGSHSEVNIESRTKRDITKHPNREDYTLLDLVCV